MSETILDTDEAIVARVTGGNIDDYELLLQRYEAKLQRYVTYLIHDSSAAFDIVQETFIKAYHNLQGFNPKYKFSSWVYRIAHNEAMNYVKKNRHLTGDDIDMLPDTPYDAKLDELVDADIIKTHVRECLAELEPKYRDVLQLVYFENMKYEEVSDVLHVPSSTVGVWLSRAKLRLRAICEQKGVER